MESNNLLIHPQWLHVALLLNAKRLVMIFIVIMRYCLRGTVDVAKVGVVVENPHYQ